MSFVHIHCRSHYSFLDSAASPEDLVKAAKAAGMSAIALTDSGNMCGLVEFAQACKDEGIKPIFGADLWTIPPDWTLAECAPGHLLTFLVENEVGYRNLCTLISRAHRQRNFVPRIEVRQLEEHAEGLIVLSGNQQGLVSMFPEEEQTGELENLKRIYGDNLFLELVNWGDGKETQLERSLELAKSLSIPTVITNNVRYTSMSGSVLLGVMHNIALGQTLNEPGAYEPHATDQAYLKNEEEMITLFPGQGAALAAAGQIAGRCNHELSLGTPYLPNSEPPEGTAQEKWDWLLGWFPPPRIFGENHTMPGASDPEEWSIVDRYFAWYARKGLEKRLELEPASLKFGTREEYWERLEMEIAVIQRMEFPAYHLIVGEFINWAKDNGISVGPGRGSAAGSVATWAMRITDINPLQFGLMFERYLNPKRISMPDIDVDFEQERREDVIEHVKEKYGTEQVGQILTIGTMKAKAAIKDCARACGIHFKDANEWSKEIDDGPKAKLSESIEGKKFAAMMRGNPRFRHVARLALAMEKRPRQTGIHAAGVIITSKPIAHFTPMHFELTKDGEKTMTGVDMTAAEKLGLVKFDFLGLKTLDIIGMALDSIQARTGERPDINDPLFDDPKVFDLLKRGDSLGLFQVESHGMQDLLRRMQPDSMEDIVAIQALYRPGPLGSGMVDQYVEVKHGRAEVQYPHPLLEEVLQSTNGVIVYQEQVMKAAQVLAGYDLGGADLLRRAMGKKKQSEMDAQRASFVEGCASNGISSEEAQKIFNLIDHFAGYGFNRSHSASYGVICYLTCKLKAHFRADLMAAAMSFEYADRDKLVAYVNDCLQASIPVLRPDINKSQMNFSVEEHNGGLAIRYGFRAIKGLGDAAIEPILSARLETKFTSVQDVRERINANKTTMNALVTSGALDDLGERFNMWWELNKPEVKVKKTRVPDNQLGLFTGQTIKEEREEVQAEKEEEEKPRRWSYSEKLEREHGALGAWLSGHPLDRFNDIETRFIGTNVLELSQAKKNRPLSMIGVITKTHRIETKTGQRMGYFTLADRIGLTEAVLRPPEWAQYSGIIERGTCVIIRGKLDQDGEKGKLVIDSSNGVESLKEFRSRFATTLHLNVYYDTKDEILEQIKAVIQRFSLRKKHGCRIRYILRGPDEEHIISIIPEGDPVVEVDQALFDEIEFITGRPNDLYIPSA